VTLKGIGGKSEPLTNAGILKHVLDNKRVVKWLCYVFDAPVGHSKRLILLGMSAIKLSGIDINHHIDESFEGRSTVLRFKQGTKHSEVTFGRVECYQYKKIDKENITPGDIYRNSENFRVTTLFDGQNNIALMTEIQLKNIVDRLGKETVTGTDGDEFTMKDGIKVSKFSKKAMEIGFDVNESLNQSKSL
jgi:hypothetical protein